MPGPRFDFGKFMETGGKFAYEILSEQKSHEKKLDEIEAKLKADKEQTQATLDAGIKEGRVKGLYDFMKSDASGESKVKMWEMHSSEGLVPSLYQIQNIAATQAGQTMPGGTAGAPAPGAPMGVEGLYTGGYTPPETGEMPKMFEPQPEEPKKYPQTRKDVEAHEVFKEKLKPKPLGKTPGERGEEKQYARDMNLINNYNAKDEQGNFTMPPETAKMIEPRVKKASMRQFGSFVPRVLETGRKGFLGIKKGDKEGYGAMQTKYKVGQIIEKGGKKYKVVSFDTDGEPLVEEIK